MFATLKGITNASIYDSQESEMLESESEGDDSDCDFDIGLTQSDESASEGEDNNNDETERSSSEPADCSSIEPDPKPMTTPGTYIAKDGTLWTNVPPKKSKYPRHDINAFMSMGPIEEAANAEIEPADLFKLYFTPEIVQVILKHTNQYAKQSLAANQKINPKIGSWKDVTENELYAFFGLLLLAGVDRNKFQPVNELWTSNPKYINQSFIATMPRARFREIQKYIRFNNKEEFARIEASGQKLSRLALISEIYKPFVETLDKYFEPGPHLTIDEMIVRFHGSVRFRVYMKSKPGKYGMKVWVLTCADTGYILKIIIYTGKVDDKVELQLGKKVVLELVGKYSGSGRGVTADNFFTSRLLVEELIEKHNLTYVGTLRQSRIEVPRELTVTKGKPLHSSEFVFHNNITLLSYISKPNKATLLLSTQHHDESVAPDSYLNKPEIVLHYNRTKGGVDTADQMIGIFSCQQATRRWPVKMFFALLDIAALNAYIIHKSHRIGPARHAGAGSRRRIFLRELAEALITPLIIQRASGLRAEMLPIHIKKAIQIYTDILSTRETPKKAEKGVKMVGRCQLCEGSTAKRKKSKKPCKNCNRFCCGDHGELMKVCTDCRILFVNVDGNTDPDNAIEIPQVGCLPVNGVHDNTIPNNGYSPLKGVNGVQGNIVPDNANEIPQVGCSRLKGVKRALDFEFM